MNSIYYDVESKLKTNKLKTYFDQNCCSSFWNVFLFRLLLPIASVHILEGIWEVSLVGWLVGSIGSWISLSAIHFKKPAANQQVPYNRWNSHLLCVWRRSYFTIKCFTGKRKRLRSIQVSFCSSFVLFDRVYRSLSMTCIRGSIHQGHEAFSEHSRGRQFAFMSLSALLFSRSYSVDSWT